jgi:prophage regulatory protein
MSRTIVRSVAEELMGVHEIAEMLGVSRQRVDEISRTHDAFPAPVATLRSGRVWARDAVELWAREAGRL